MDLGTFIAQAGNAPTIEDGNNIGTSRLHETHSAVLQPKRRRLDGKTSSATTGTIEDDEENEVNELTAPVSCTSNIEEISYNSNIPNDIGLVLA